MLLLTGATGPFGHAVVRRLTASGTPVRCLVRDPRRLGPERVRVQLAIGDLADPASWRNALRGIDAVVHLAGGARAQPRATVEEPGPLPPGPGGARANPRAGAEEPKGRAAGRLWGPAEPPGPRHFVWLE